MDTHTVGPQGHAVNPPPKLPMAGEWETVAERTLELFARVNTRKAPTGKSKAAEYQWAPVPLDDTAQLSGALAAWRFLKYNALGGVVEHYTVLLHTNGHLSCDCKFGTMGAERDAKLCLHRSALLTAADALKALVLPLPEVPPPPE